MPQHEHDIFKKNIAYARDLAATAGAIGAQTTAAISTDDFLRSSLVQGVSAFDHFVHEEVRSRMILIQQGHHARTVGFDRFRVSLASVNTCISAGGTAWLESEIRAQHGHLSFQHPDKVADAFRLVTDVPLWDAVANHLGRTSGDTKRQLILIVDRRNKIAHEADTDPTPPRTRYPIDLPLVTESLDFLEGVVEALVIAT